MSLGIDLSVRLARLHCPSRRRVGDPSNAADDVDAQRAITARSVSDSR